MKPFNGYKPEKIVSRETLPAGGYIAEILKAEEVPYDWGNVLVISFDIAEGQYKDHFEKDYKAQTNEDRKWRGTCRINIPKDDGTEKDAFTKKMFNNAMYAIEDSNPGYKWNWNETTLNGKKIGVLFRNKEWEYNGKTGWTTECYALASVNDIRSGNYKIAKDKPLKNKSVSTGNLPFYDSREPYSELYDNDKDLPF